MRASEFGWKKELFEGFEEKCSYGRGYGSGPSHLERIGKKYQWIALHELLARLSDNVHWIGFGYDDIEDKDYSGPWQMTIRDIDPTLWIRDQGEEDTSHSKKLIWWQEYAFPIEELNTIDDQLEFVWSKDIIPDFSRIVEVSDPQGSGDWLILKGFGSQRQSKESEKDSTPQLDTWYRINSIIIKKEDYEKVKTSIDQKNLIDPNLVNVPSTDHQNFLGEYPWHPSCRFMTGWVEYDKKWSSLIPVDYFVPISEYERERANGDYSIDSSLSFYMPAISLIEDLKLFRSKENFGAWNNEQRENIFLDPSVLQQGPSCALIRKSVIQKWLDKNNLEILWMIGGEKQLFGSYTKSYGRLVFNSLVRMENDQVTSSVWFEPQEGED